MPSICRVALGHTIHMALLLLPTALLVGPGGVGPSAATFAILVVLATVAESTLTSPCSRSEAARNGDPVAVRVAGMVETALLAAFWAAQVEAVALGPGPLLLQIAGGGSVAAGILLRLGAIRTLGPRFVTDIDPVGPIVREGIYAWLRHPSEVGLLLLAVGGPMLLGSPLTTLAAAVTFPSVSLRRIRREDAALAAIQQANSGSCQFPLLPFDSLLALHA
ncbi:MAG: methyltransferase family protein [Planctomycetota bacterium]